MISILRTRLHQGHQTNRFPQEVPALPARFRGRPQLSAGACADACHDCAAACPTGAIQTQGGLSLDLGRCVFCAECASACDAQVITFTNDHRMACSTRADLRITPEKMLQLAAPMADQLRRVLGRSLKLREVCAGSCNACDLDINVLTTVGWDLSRFGIQFVASPRHADGMVLTGPITHNMHHAVIETWNAIPHPKIAIAVGTCAIAGGPYIDCPQVHNGGEGILPRIDLFVPGCPPHPLTILDGLLRLIGRIADPQPEPGPGLAAPPPAPAPDDPVSRSTPRPDPSAPPPAPDAPAPLQPQSP